MGSLAAACVPWVLGGNCVAANVCMEEISFFVELKATEEWQVDVVYWQWIGIRLAVDGAIV